MTRAISCSCNEGMGMMQPQCRKSGACCGSQEPGCLEFLKMDSLDKHVEQVSFRQCVTFCRHRQLTGWQPHSNPLLLKAQSPHIAIVDMANGKKHIPIFRNKLWRPQLRDQTYAFLHMTQIRNLRQRDRIFCKHSASIMHRW